MAKKEIRMLVASEDVAGIIDHGADVDTQIKDLTDEDKGIKSKLTETLASQMQEGEVSIRVKGNTAAAVITASEKVEVDYASGQFAAVKDAVDKGILDGVVEQKKSIALPQDDVKKAVEILNQAGIKATMTETLSVKAEALRQEAKSVEQAKAMVVLGGCVKREKTYRVKYEKAQE